MALRFCFISLAIIGTVTPPTASPAQDFNAPTSPCEANVTTPELVRCFDRALHASDARLNQTYNKVMQALEPDDRRNLVQAERIWMRYRDATCTAERDLFDGGTAAAPAELSCRVAETRARIAALQRAYGWRVEKFGK